MNVIEHNYSVVFKSQTFRYQSDSVVAVTVVTYNSENTVVETLESILYQSYGAKYLELIISDDCSTDSTVSLINEWLKKFYSHFHSAKLLVSNENYGVSINCNLAWKAVSASKWIKTIAGDDMLTIDCISDNIKYCNNNPSAEIVFSDAIAFSKEVADGVIIKNYENFFKENKLENQFTLLINECKILAPTSFISCELLKTIGYANERYPMIEDYPLWFNLLKMGHKFHYFAKATVFYRVGDTISQQKNRIGNLKYLNSLFLFQKECIWPCPEVGFFKKIDDFIIYYEKSMWIQYLGNEKSTTYNMFHYALCLLRPYRIKKFLLSFFRKERS